MRWFSLPKPLPIRYAGATSADQHHPAMSVKVDYEPAITIIGTAPDAERAALPTLDEVIESCDRFRPADPLSWLTIEIMISPAGLDLIVAPWAA